MLSLIAADLIVCAIMGIAVNNVKDVLYENLIAYRARKEQKGVSARNYQKVAFDREHGYDVKEGEDE